MLINRWIIIGLSVFLLIEILSLSFPHDGGYVCPNCNGKGKIWIEGAPSAGVEGWWATCETCGGTGWIWMFSMQLVAAIVSLISLLSFLGLFFLMYISSAFRAEMNPYVNEVKEMDWPFNPMYFAWLFVNDTRKWCLYSTIITAPFGFMLGAIVSVAAALKEVAFSNLALGLLAGIGFIIIATLCWYNGICKPLTE